MLVQRVKKAVNSFLGQKSGLPIESYGMDAAEQISNFTLRNGRLERVPGSTVYSSILDDQAGGVTSLSRFKDMFVGQRGNALTCETAEGSQIFETITSDLLSTQKMFTAPWRDRLFFTNGTDNTFLLNRAQTLTGYKYGFLGMDPPPFRASGPFFSINPGVGGNIPDGTYYYLITLFDAETNSESPGYASVQAQDGLYELSPNNEDFGPQPAVVTISGGPDPVVVGGTELSSYLVFAKAQVPRATHFVIYRGQKVGGGATGLYESFFRVPNTNASSSMNGDIFINIDTFIDEGLSFIDNTAVLGSVSLPENNSPPPTKARINLGYNWAVTQGLTTDSLDQTNIHGFRHMRFFRDQLFGIGAKSPGYNVSQITVGDDQMDIIGVVNDFIDILYGSEVYQPDYYPYLWEVARGDGQDAIGLGVLGDTALLVFKEKSTYYLSGSSPSDYVLRVMDTSAGCVHESTIQETPIGVITLDNSGFVLFNKIGIGTRVSDDIENIIDDILFEYASTFYSEYDPVNRFYYCSVVVAGSQTPNITLCLNLESMQWSTQQGAEGLSRVIDVNSNREIVDVIGSKSTGRLLDFSDEENVTNDGAGIVSIWTSGPIDFGDDQHKKKMRWLYVRALCASSWTVDIEVIPDYEESRKYVIEDWGVLSSQSTWYSSDIATDGSLIWDEGNWASAGPERKISKIPIVCKGYTFQVRITNKSTDELAWGFALEGVSAEAEMLEK